DADLQRECLATSLDDHQLPFGIRLRVGAADRWCHRPVAAASADPDLRADAGARSTGNLCPGTSRPEAARHVCHDTGLWLANLPATLGLGRGQRLEGLYADLCAAVLRLRGVRPLCLYGAPVLG